MNKRTLKRIVSLVLVVVIAVSTVMVSAVSVSAETEFVTYKFDFQTAGSSGTSDGNVSIKVNGEKGSTSRHKVDKVAKNRTGSASFSDIDVGTIESITVFVASSGFGKLTLDEGRDIFHTLKEEKNYDGWYPEIIKITVGEATTTIFGGRWVDDGNEVTLSVTDQVAKVTVKTSDNTYSGTDNTVSIILSELYNNERINLSEIHPESNAFEKGDLATFYIYVSSRLFSIEVEVDGDLIDDWRLDYIEVLLDGVTKIYPHNDFIDCHGYSVCLYEGFLYKVTVKTSNKTLAGTDNDVYLRTYDGRGNELGKSNFLLDNSKNNFEKNDTDVFYVASMEKIIDIRMKVDECLGTEWHLDYVQIDLIKGNDVVESVKYNYKQWIKAGKKLHEPTSKEVLL